MNEFEKSVDEIILNAIDLLKVEEINYDERILAVEMIEAGLGYFKRKLRQNASK